MRNRFYVACGYTIVTALLPIIIYAVLPSNIQTYLAQLKPVFRLESIAVVAFGISRLVK